MTTDQKIDELLKLIKEQGRQLLLVIHDQGERHERRFDELETRMDQFVAKIEKVLDRPFVKQRKRNEDFRRLPRH